MAQFWVDANSERLEDLCNFPRFLLLKAPHDGVSEAIRCFDGLVLEDAFRHHIWIASWQIPKFVHHFSQLSRAQTAYLNQ